MKSVQSLPADQDKRRARTLLNAGNLGEAKSVLEKVCKRTPGDTEARYLLGAIYGQLGQFRQAEQCFRKILSQFPAHAETCDNLGLSLHRQGKTEEAVKYYRKALKVNPQAPLCNVNIGNALMDLGRFQEAADHYKKATALDNTNSFAWFNLGNALKEDGKFAEAIEVYEKCLTVSPEFAEAWNNLGIAHEKQGDLDQSLSSYQRAIDCKADYAEAHYNAGIILEKQKRTAEADESYQRALRYKPEYPEAHQRLGGILQHRGKLGAAARHYLAALRLDPDNTDYLLDAGAIYHLSAKYRDARQYYDRALQLRKDHAPIYYHIGLICSDLGDFDDSDRYFKKALELDPDHGPTITALANNHYKKREYDDARRTVLPLIKAGTDNPWSIAVYVMAAAKLGDVEEPVTVANEYLENHKPATMNQLHVHFALGEAYEREKQYEKAFEHFRTANELEPVVVSEESQQQYVNELKNTFDGNFMRTAPRASNRSKKPVFIVGMPRSGTSLTEQILASHREVYGAGELPEIGRLADLMQERTGSGRKYPACVREAGKDTLDYLAEQYLEFITAIDRDATRITDKMPHNFWHLGLIELLFPEAHILYCVRNPLDCCLSIYTKHFNASHDYASDLERLGRHYLQHQDLMAHWLDVSRLPVMKVAYEELVTDPDTIIHRLVEFCELEWDPDCLRFYENQRLINTPSADQVRQPIYRSAIGKWKLYERQLEPLRKVLQEGGIDVRDTPDRSGTGPCAVQ